MTGNPSNIFHRAAVVPTGYGRRRLRPLFTAIALMLGGACEPTDSHNKAAEGVGGADKAGSAQILNAGSDGTPGDGAVAQPSGPLQPTSAKRRAAHVEGRGDGPKPTKKKLSVYSSAMIAGDAALYSGLLDEARTHYFRAMEARPGAMSPALGALRALRTRGRGEERAGVVRVITKKIDALAAVPATVGAGNLLSARMAIALGQIGEAVDAATLAVELLPALGVAWRVRGEAAMVGEDWAGAVKALRRAAALGLQAKAGTWERMADALDELGQLEAAEESARKAVVLTGSDPHARRRRLNLLGTLLKRRGKLSEAKDIVGQAVALGPDDPMVLHNLAAVLEAEGATDEALATYAKALGRAPLPMTHWRRGRLLLQNDRHAEALSHFKAAAAQLHRWSWPQSTAFWPAYDAAKLYARGKRFQDALGWFEDASRLAMRPRDLREIRSWVVYTRAEKRRANR